MGQTKPELLMPAGNVESFRAAIRGGADAIYLGLKQFNARVRANNFTAAQLPAIMQEARNNKVKIYITLNTVIKNKEIDPLLDFLFFLEKVGIDAIIVQDWGVYHLARQYFPKLAIHASTQMGIHNSVGIKFAATLGITRVVLAREITLPELEKMADSPACELEIFIHGALCYSFSGQCYFSSYIGGRGANRGLCSQPCRMIYQEGQQSKYLFNLKDNQQIESLPQLAEMGIHSLKVEGRMKSADYVFRVASSYRMALDHPEKTNEAAEMLQLDFGRAKTGYFLGHDVKVAIANTSNTGIPAGKIIRVSGNEVTFMSNCALQNGDRLRILQKKSMETVSVKLENVWIENNRFSFSYTGKDRLSAGDEVFWIGRREQSFPSRLPNVPAPAARMPLQMKKSVKQKLETAATASRPGLFVRIDSPGWLPLMRMDEIDGLILSFSKNELEHFSFEQTIIQKYKHKIHIELPKFIAEGQVVHWLKLVNNAESSGIHRFVVSHLSQKLLISKSSTVSCNEQVYVFNDAAAAFLKKQNVQHFCYPIENDLDNLLSMHNKSGMVILHSFPELFYSRMPVRLQNKDSQFKDSFNKTYTKTIRDGISIVVPDRPVNLFQYKNQLTKAGFSRFLIDLKHEQPSKNAAKRIFSKFKSGEMVQPSTIFNFKKGLQ